MATSQEKQLSDGNANGTILGQSATDLIAFYGETGKSQVDFDVNASKVATTAATTGTTGATPFGFTTAAQAAALIATVNEMLRILNKLGLIKGGV